jgi:hypothetical protein
MRAANPDLYNTITENRSTAGEDRYIVYCANCAEAFALAGKAHAHILDLVFPNTAPNTALNTVPSTVPNTAASNTAQNHPPLPLQKRRDNAAQTKSALTGLYEGKSFAPAPNPWDPLRLTIPKKLLPEMDCRLILEDDLKEAIYEAERTGSYFTLPNGAPGGGELRQCSLIRNVVTTWVQYTPEHTVTDAWSHRLRFTDEGQS